MEHWPTVDEHVVPLLIHAESSLDAATAAALKKDGRALNLTRAANVTSDALGARLPR